MLLCNTVSPPPPKKKKKGRGCKGGETKKRESTTVLVPSAASSVVFHLSFVPQTALETSQCCSLIRHPSLPLLAAPFPCSAPLSAVLSALTPGQGMLEVRVYRAPLFATVGGFIFVQRSVECCPQSSTPGQGM